tara:strand:- start:158 stop:538 length:381 start_codon:yes stop_codon:yes gene_type:complete
MYAYVSIVTTTAGASMTKKMTATENANLKYFWAQILNKHERKGKFSNQAEAHIDFREALCIEWNGLPTSEFVNGRLFCDVLTEWRSYNKKKGRSVCDVYTFNPEPFIHCSAKILSPGLVIESIDWS